MSNLPFMNKNIQSILAKIKDMKRGGAIYEQKPHKLILLLTILDLFDMGEIKANQIYFNEKLINTFQKNFSLYAKQDDWCQAAPPFFHLRSSSFWKHKIKPGHEEVYSHLSTSGGGSKRIIENIEFAYFDEITFSIFEKAESREAMRDFIVKELIATDMKRIPALFHESFSLSRSSIIQILKAIQNVPSDIPLNSKSEREDYFQSSTNLGKNYIKSMPYYCKGTGLISFDYQITIFGQMVLSKEIHLDQLGTQWLMHYHLSAPQGPGPSFWHEAITRLIFTGNIFTGEDLVEAIGNHIWQTENRILAKRGVQSTATVFLGTYLKPEGLNKIHILETTDSGRYRVCEPAPAPIWAIGCALVDYWLANYPDRLGISLDTLADSSFLKIFLMGKSRLMEVLQAMQEVGYVELHRTAPPYQIVLVRQDTEGLLKKLYGTD
jgi:hypothetical protein